MLSHNRSLLVTTRVRALYVLCKNLYVEIVTS